MRETQRIDGSARDGRSSRLWERPGRAAPVDRIHQALLEDPSRIEIAPRGRAISVVSGGAFVATAVAMGVFLPWQRPLSLLSAAVLVVLYAVASRVELKSGTAAVAPTQLVLVPMLFALPAATAPLFVVAASVVAVLAGGPGRTARVERGFVLLSSSWHAVGAALVLALFAAPEPSWGDWELYVAALGAQLAFHLVAFTVREGLRFRTALSLLARSLAFIYLVDVVLAPLGLLIAFPAANFSLALLLVLPFLGLLAHLARERASSMEVALELEDACRRANADARRDPVTGLANRLAWEEAVTAADARRDASAPPTAVIVVDLNDLKLANDLCGHKVGDELLRRTAAALASNIPRAAFAARTGGDEFAVLMSAADGAACVDTIARIERSLDREGGVDGFPLTAAIGFATSPPARSVREAQELADAAMYSRKKRLPAIPLPRRA